MAQKTRLAIIGAGAIAELLHLPAARATEDMELVALFDPNTARAQMLAATYAIPLVDASYEQHLDAFDAAIVATPNNTHAAISIALLQAGKHVLVEKPVAFSTAQLNEMIAAEQQSKAKIVVAHIKRFYPYHIFIKKLLQEQTFGKLKSINIQYTTIFAYPMASDSFLRKESAGGGVFFDMGVHFLDLVYWWLGDIQVVSYQDDAEDGIDASMEMSLLAGQEQIPVSLTLGRLRTLPFETRLEFEQSTFIIRSVYGGGYTLTTAAGTLVGDLPGLAGRPYLQNGIDQLKAFHQTITNQAPPAVSLQDGLAVLQLIEQAYAQKQPIQYEWEQVEL